ncbi:MAG TPA: response regulator transcription factor [Anaerolineae bacterium]|nr:response regulator transcription factor [Anaerolineae bacterium]HMR63926.1 response regulator transcription factor [Anaerolineae bacterium]
MPIQILIADDHGVLRAGLRALLSAEEGIAVVGEAGDGPEALRLAALLEPDMVLLDLSMPGLSGIEVTRQLKKDRPCIHTLILTVHEDRTLLEEALHAGASGYILKKAVESELIDAIRAVSRGEMYVHPAMTRALLSKLASETAPPQQEHEFLTPRETEVLQLIAQGHTNRQIAVLLNISIRTVESHRANLMGKLGLQSRVELVRYARERDLLDK